MSSRHRVSRAAIELIKRFEGYRRTAAQLPDGRWTIGYGHTLTAREGAEVSEPDAEALLVYDLIGAAHAVNEALYAPTTQNQFDALCSFAFNIGVDNFRRSQVLKRLNTGAAVQAACEMELWRKAEFEGERIVIDALVRRRAAEKALFLTPPGDAWVPAPSPILRPLIDLDALDLVPVRRPVELEAAMDGDKVLLRRDETDEPFEGPAAVTAAAEAVTARLEKILAEPEPEEPAAAEALGQLRPQADFAPPITASRDFSEPEEESPLEPAPAKADFQAPPADELEIPEAPDALETALSEPAPFIPIRSRPAPRRKDAPLIWDLLLALFGLAFFGFGMFWGLNAVPTPRPAVGFVTPVLVAWLAGLAGVGFIVVAVFRLLERLGREVERD